MKIETKYHMDLLELYNKYERLEEDVSEELEKRMAALHLETNLLIEQAESGELTSFNPGDGRTVTLKQSAVPPVVICLYVNPSISFVAITSPSLIEVSFLFSSPHRQLMKSR